MSTPGLALRTVWFSYNSCTVAAIFAARADELDVGAQLLAADGALEPADGLIPGTERVDIAYNLAIEEIHTYFVAAGDTAVLVHNECPPPALGLTTIRSNGSRNSHALAEFAESHGAITWQIRDSARYSVEPMLTPLAR